MDAPDGVTVHVRGVPGDLWHRVKVAAAERNESLRTFVTRAIEARLDTLSGESNQ